MITCTETRYDYQFQFWQDPPFRPIWPGTRGGFLDRSAQNFGKWTLFWPISLVKSHFGGSKIAIFSRLRRAQQGKMLFLVAPQAKILGIYLVKSTKPLKYCVFSVFALRITKKRSQSEISQILRIWVSGTRGGFLLGGGFLLELGLNRKPKTLKNVTFSLALIHWSVQITFTRRLERFGAKRLARDSMLRLKKRKENN